MTAQEKDRIECAIRHIQTAVDVDPWAAEIAVEAMKAQLSREDTTSDLISRQEAIDVLGVFTQADALGHTPKQIVEALPSAHPEIEERKEESAQNVPKEDLISRKAAIDVAENAFVRGFLASPDIRKLPSVQPERKTGRWLIREGISDAQCSECKMYFRDVYDMENSDAFCRHCGAKMEGLKVVEDE